MNPSHDQEAVPLSAEPRPITFDEHERAVMAVKLELVGGFLIDGVDDPERRERLFLTLLKNLGLRRAIELVGHDRWKEALGTVS
jgi:hypothetical protein